MNPQSTKERKTPSREFHQPEDRHAPHLRSPSSKEVVPSVSDRDRTEARGRKPLPVARPARSRRQQDSVTARRVTATTSIEQSTPPRHRPSAAQFNVRMAFTILGFSVAAVLVILFGLDLAMGIPFERISLPMDETYVICGLTLGWLSWSCFRDLR